MKLFQQICENLDPRKFSATGIWYISHVNEDVQSSLALQVTKAAWQDGGLEAKGDVCDQLPSGPNLVPQTRPGLQSVLCKSLYPTSMGEINYSSV